MTIHVKEDDGKPIFETGLVSLGDNEFYITTNYHGMYVIRTRGPGGSPKLCDEVFTSLREARKALDAYQLEHKMRLDMHARLGPKTTKKDIEAKKAVEE